MATIQWKAVGGSSWTDLPEPAKDGYTVTVLDLDSEAGGTGRDQSGLMHRDRVAVKRKIEYIVPAQRSASISALLNRFTAVFFELKYYDPLSNAYRTGTFYVGDRAVQSHHKFSDNSFLVQSVKLSFIER